MELIKQPSFETCGQACIAMITGKDINDVIRDMKTSRRRRLKGRRRPRSRL